MNERPIIFSGPMVRAILEDRKMQTRLVIKLQPSEDWLPEVGHYEPTCIDKDGMEYPGKEIFGASDEEEGRKFPYGQPGDRLWVRETWLIQAQSSISNRDFVFYRADIGNTHLDGRWKPAIHMPRWASRITLEIVKVRVERVQEISEQDALADGGWVYGNCPIHKNPQSSFAQLWDSINAKREGGEYSWAKNPWAWVLEFKRLSLNGERAGGREKLPASPNAKELRNAR